MANLPINLEGKDSGATTVLDNVKKALKGTLDVAKLTSKELRELNANFTANGPATAQTVQELRNFARAQAQVNQALRERRKLRDHSHARVLDAARTRQLTAATVASGTAIKATGLASLEARRGISTMRGAMGTLAASSLGLQGRLGEVAGIMGSFAVGNVVTLGILGGLAAIAFAFREATAEAKALREENDKVLTSLEGIGESAIGSLKARERQAKDAQKQRIDDLAAVDAFLATRDQPRGDVQVRAGLAAGGAVNRAVGVKRGATVGLGGVTESAFNAAEQAATKLAMEIASNENTLSRVAAEIDRLRKLQAAQRQAELDKEAAKSAELFAAWLKATKEGIDATPNTPSDPVVPLTVGFRLAAEGSLGPHVAAARERMRAGGAFSGPIGGMQQVESVLNERRNRLVTSPEEALAALARITAALKAFGVNVEDLSATQRQGIDGLHDIAGDLEEAGDNVGISSRQLVSALAQAANAIAGMVTGRTSVAGGIGGLAAGLSSLPGPHQAALGIAGIGLSFLDALTSDRGKNAMADAHLKALREANAERPPANIFINIPGFDPTNRDHQRIIDDARSEAAASGFRVDVRTP